MSNFAFLAAEFPPVHEAAAEAERQAGVSPTAAAFFAGKTVEVAVKWAFRSDPGLKLPYQDNIAALLHEPSFRRATGEAVFAKARYINTLRNRNYPRGCVDFSTLGGSGRRSMALAPRREG